MTDFQAGCIAACIAGIVLFICVTVGCIHNDTMTRDKAVACAEAGMQWSDGECRS